MGDTSIEWCRRPGTRARTWNPTQGCALKSAGCKNCYAMRQAARFAGPGKPFNGLVNIKTKKWTGEARLATHKLTEPLSWRQPSTVFVNSMSDLFYEEFTNEEIAAVFGVMAACPQHTFQVLTKRASRMREWFSWMANDGIERADRTFDPRAASCWDFAKAAVGKTGASIEYSDWNREFMDRAHLIRWPLQNVWLGVSVEDQDAADERIPDLLRTPAAVRFLSCEPLLGPVRLHEWLGREHGLAAIGAPPGLSWVIVGCESGPGARTCDVDWIRSLRDQCAVAGVALFVKQARPAKGSLASSALRPAPIDSGAGSRWKNGAVITLPYLDGVQHAAFPEVL